VSPASSEGVSEHLKYNSNVKFNLDILVNVCENNPFYTFNKQSKGTKL
jgi:hypothetical protein